MVAPVESIKVFEDLIVWQEGIKVADAIYEITRHEGLVSDRSLRDQMRRAAVSVPSNIAEGFERNANAEFLYFLSVAKGSAGELRSLLYVARNAGYLDESTFLRLREDASLISRRIFTLMAVLQRGGWKGVRYRRSQRP